MHDYLFEKAVAHSEVSEESYARNLSNRTLTAGLLLFESMTVLTDF